MVLINKPNAPKDRARLSRGAEELENNYTEMVLNEDGEGGVVRLGTPIGRGTIGREPTRSFPYFLNCLYKEADEEVDNKINIKKIS